MSRRPTTSSKPSVPPKQKRGDVSHVDTHGVLDQATVSLVGHDLKYRVRWASGESGPEVVSLTIESSDDRPISSDDLRSIPLRRLASAAAQACGAQPWSELTVTWKDVRTIHWRDLDPSSATPSGKRRAITDEFLAELAGDARAAFRAGRKVRETLADKHECSVYSVDKWLAAARERGYLEPGELSIKRK